MQLAVERELARVPPEHVGRLADALEGLFNAGEFKDAEFRTAWYDHWSALEQGRDVEPDAPGYEEVVREIESLARLLGNAARGTP